jgi:hypothetical protein
MTARIPNRSVATLAAAVVLFLGLSLWMGAYATQNAFVDYRYGANLAGGYGPVYNIGAPPSEGYTSLLWVGCASLLSRFGAAPHTGAPYLSMLFGLLSLVVLWDLLRLRRDPVLPSLAVVLALAAAAPFVAAAANGTDASLFGLLLLASVWALERALRHPGFVRWIVLGAAVVLCAMCRLEGVVVVAVVVAALVRSDDEAAPPRRGRIVAAAVIAAAVVVFHAWRALAFGDVIPASLATRLGWHLDALFVSRDPYAAYGLFYVAAFVLTAYGCRAGRGPRDAAAAAIALVPAILYLGVHDPGPGQPDHAALLPVAAVLWPRALCALGDTFRAGEAAFRRRFVIPIALALLALALGLVADLRITVRLTDEVNRGALRHLGEWVGHWYPGATIATGAPALAYFSRARTLDLRPHSRLGHSSADAAGAVSEVRPAIVFLPANGFRLEDVAPDYAPLVREAHLAEDYRRARAIRVEWERDVFMVMLLRNGVEAPEGEAAESFPLGIDEMRRVLRDVIDE